jgi:hypothetical protein
MDGQSIYSLNNVLPFAPIGNKKMGKEIALDAEDQDNR